MVSQERGRGGDGSLAFAAFMAGAFGRIARIAVGLVLIAVGLGVVGEAWGIVLAIVGLAPLAAGLFNFCLIAPIIGAPFWGRDARS